jgi:hypothetical protein
MTDPRLFVEVIQLIANGDGKAYSVLKEYHQRLHRISEADARLLRALMTRYDQIVSGVNPK